MHPRTRPVLAALAGALLLAGCVSVNATRLGPATARPPVPAEEVAIYRTADQIPGRYEEVALLNASGDASMTNESQLFRAMRRKAGQLGANAIILDAVSEPGAGTRVAAAVLGVGVDRRGKAVAVYVLPDSAATAAGAAGGS